MLPVSTEGHQNHGQGNGVLVFNLKARKAKIPWHHIDTETYKAICVICRNIYIGTCTSNKITIDVYMYIDIERYVSLYLAEIGSLKKVSGMEHI